MPKRKKGFRIEKDSLGDVYVPNSALYGAQTQRAIENFPISGIKMDFPLPTLLSKHLESLKMPLLELINLLVFFHQKKQSPSQDLLKKFGKANTMINSQ